MFSTFEFKNKKNTKQYDIQMQAKKYLKTIDKEDKKSYNKNRSRKELFYMQVSYNGYYLSLPS